MGRDASNLTCTRPKLRATVSASPEAKTLNFAGPQISSSPPPTNSTRALPACTITALPPPNVIAREEFPLTICDGPSTEISSPAISPRIGVVACAPARAAKIPQANNTTAPNAPNCLSNEIFIGIRKSVRANRPTLTIAILYADERARRIGSRPPRHVGRGAGQYSLRYALAQSLALAAHANSNHCMGGLFHHPSDRADDALRSSGLAACAARVQSRRASDRHILAPVDFLSHLVVAQPRHRSDEHNKL